MSSSDFDAVVIGAGIGGVSVASLLAKKGKKTLLVEKIDRVGGRALSFLGSELADKGLEWFHNLLNSQYSHLAYSDPPIEEIAKKRMLDGFTLDLGYHGVSLAGKGYFKRVADSIGGVDVTIKPFLTGFWHNRIFYEEFKVNDRHMDKKLLDEFKKVQKKPSEFFSKVLFRRKPDLESLDKVSIHDYLVNNEWGKPGEVVYEYFACAGRLFSTINNPKEISVGDIIRYYRDTILEPVIKGEDTYVGGFAEGGAIQWPKQVETKFKALGGETWLNTNLKRISTDGDTVNGVELEQEGKIIDISAPIVVLNIPIQSLFKYIDKELFPEKFVQRVESLYGYGSIAPYIALDKTKLDIPENHACRLIKTPCVVPKGDGLSFDAYMSWNFPSYKSLTPSCAPDNMHLFSSYLPLTEKEALDPKILTRVAKAVPEFMDEIYPGFKDAMVWQLYPACWKLEGVAKSITQAGSLKPDVIAPNVNGLYFAGDTVRGYGVAMDCAAAAALLCVQKIIESPMVQIN